MKRTRPLDSPLDNLLDLLRPRWAELPSTRRERLTRIETIYRRLADAGDRDVVWWVPVGLAHPEPRVVAAAAESAERLLGLWPVERWTALDGRLRTAWSTVPSMLGPTPRNEQPTMIERLPQEDVARPNAARVAGLVIMVFHANGLVRERALEALERAAIAHRPEQRLAAVVLRLDGVRSPTTSSARPPDSSSTRRTRFAGGAKSTW